MRLPVRRLSKTNSGMAGCAVLGERLGKLVHRIPLVKRAERWCFRERALSDRPNSIHRVQFVSNTKSLRARLAGDSPNGANLIQGGERRRFAMPIPLRGDFDAPRLRAIARGTKDAAQTRRLLALAAVYDGARRTAAAAIGGGTLQSGPGMVMKFNAHRAHGPLDPKAPGQP